MHRHMITAVAFFSIFGTTLTLNAGTPDAKAEIEAFNTKYLRLHQKMDSAGIMALWAEDGVDLMPGEAPIMGKKAIADWLHNTVAKFPNTKITKQELEWHNIQISGDWASEWANEHQAIQPGGDKAPIESYGKMILILHREDGEWKVKQEMWNNSPQP